MILCWHLVKSVMTTIHAPIRLYQSVTLLPNSTFYQIMRGFHRTSATGVACRHGSLTPPDTLSRPIWNLHMFNLLRKILFLILVIIFSDYMHIEHSLVLPLFAFDYLHCELDDLLFHILKRIRLNCFRLTNHRCPDYVWLKVLNIPQTLYFNCKDILSLSCFYSNAFGLLLLKNIILFHLS